jgi:hypothetical protein
MGDCIDQFARRANVGDCHSAEVRLRGFAGEADFVRDERDGLRRVDARAERFAGVAIEAAGEIDGEHGTIGMLHRFNDRGERIGRGTVQSCAEEGVDH